VKFNTIYRQMLFIITQVKQTKQPSLGT